MNVHERLDPLKNMESSTAATDPMNAHERPLRLTQRALLRLLGQHRGCPVPDSTFRRWRLMTPIEPKPHYSEAETDLFIQIAMHFAGGGKAGDECLFQLISDFEDSQYEQDKNPPNPEAAGNTDDDGAIEVGAVCVGNEPEWNQVQRSSGNPNPGVIYSP